MSALFHRKSKIQQDLSVEPLMTRIDLNSDLGESFGAWTMGADEALMASITSANVACGFHAGDPTVMRRTIALAKAKGVAVGAHPGFADLVGFGRREMQLSPAEVEDLVLYQVSAIAGVAAAEGVRLQHVKAHGALYNMAARDAALAAAIARAVAAFDRSLIFFGLPNSPLLREAEKAGLEVAAEIFADRTYESDGSLTSRRKPGSVIHDPAQVVDRAVQMVKSGRVTATDGSEVALRTDTMCLHGDTPGSAELARRIRAALEAAGVSVAPLRPSDGTAAKRVQTTP
jgi:5-oxoprolinase (ATP-hydrolysing) subunit A